MYDKEFYPTPNEVTAKMVEPFLQDLNKKIILEPSAGNGAILDYITSRTIYHAKKDNCYAIEQNQESVFVLQGKGYRILSNDFLTYRPTHCFDLILMNPPFSNGDEHLLHAWAIMHTGDIVCLLNAETINNPYTKRRQLLADIISNHGTVEMLGDCFRMSDRRTDVNVALVRLHKEQADERWNIDFSGAKVDKAPSFEELQASTSAVATNDPLGAYLESYDKMQDAVVEYLKAYKKLSFYSKPFMDVSSLERLAKETNDRLRERDGELQRAYNAFIDEAKQLAWKGIVSNIGMDKYMTANMRASFDKFCIAQGAYELNRDNVRKLIEFVCMNTGNIMKKAVVDVYDTFVRFFKGNAVHTEGWKTNNQFKVNRKVILPNFVDASYRHYSAWYRYNEYADIDKVMCWLSGIPYEQLDEEDKYGNIKYISLRSAIGKVDVGDSSLHESTFFQFRCYKKGTLHITFKDESLWARFNIVVNEGKNQIGY